MARRYYMPKFEYLMNMIKLKLTKYKKRKRFCFNKLMKEPKFQQFG